MLRITRVLVAMSMVAVLVGSCGGGGDAATTAAPSTTAAATTTTTTTTTTTAAPTTTTSEIPQRRIEEISFRSGEFELVGDLVVPAGDGPHPAVIVVSGSGPQTRYSTPGYQTVWHRFGDAGFAVFSWDKPGSGDSTGSLSDEYEITERAEILVAGIAAIAARRDIDAGRIGLWGLSQAGWVMPKALAMTDEIAFMIVVSGGAEDSIEQLAYLIGRRLVCQGGSEKDGELVETYAAPALKAETYEAHKRALEVIIDVPGLDLAYGAEVRLVPEADWRPWPRGIDSFFDPMDVIEQTTIPVLAIYGELDKNIDPIQGGTAYETALETAGNTNYHVEVIPGVGHTMLEHRTGCIGEAGSATSARYLELLDEWIVYLAESL